MRIVYFSNSTLPSKAANSIHVMKMCNAFAKNGHDVTLIAKGGSKDNLNLKQLFAYYGVASSFKLKLLKQHNFPFAHVVYAILSVWYAKNLKAELTYSRNIYSTFFASVFGFKCVYEAHSPENFTWSLKKVFKFVYKNHNVKKIVVISEALKIIIESFYGLSNKVLVAHDGADITSVANKYNEFIQKTDDNFNAVYVGHLYKGRGIDLMVELARLCKDIKFHIVGGHDTDVVYWKEITGNFVNIKFHGFVSPANTESFRINANVLLAPYQNKVAISGGKGDTSKWMSPLKIFEYMASNVPILCSRIPVLEEVLIDNENALLCAPNDINEWKSALYELHKDKKKGKLLASNAFNVFKEKYTWQARATNLIESIM